MIGYSWEKSAFWFLSVPLSFCLLLSKTKVSPLAVVPKAGF